MGMTRRPFSFRRLMTGGQKAGLVTSLGLGLGLGLVCAALPLAAQPLPVDQRTAATTAAVGAATLPPLSNDPAAFPRQGPSASPRFPFLGEIAPRPQVPVSIDAMKTFERQLLRARDAAHGEAATLRREEHIPDPAPGPTRLPEGGHTSDAGAAATGRAISAATA